MLRKNKLFIVLFLCFFSSVPKAEENLLKDVDFSVVDILTNELESYKHIIGLDNDFKQKISDNDDTYKDVKTYFDNFYSNEDVPERKERLVLLASGLQYPLNMGIENSAEIYSDAHLIQLGIRQNKLKSYLASYSVALSRFLQKLAKQGDRRRQLGEHMISWKFDQNGKIIRSPIENLREDVQMLTYITTNTVLPTLDTMIIVDASKLATMALYALSAQGNISLGAYRKITEQ